LQTPLVSLFAVCVIPHHLSNANKLLSAAIWKFLL